LSSQIIILCRGLVGIELIRGLALSKKIGRYGMRVFTSTEPHRYATTESSELGAAKAMRAASTLSV
jgi:hypothetical protein